MTTDAESTQKRRRGRWMLVLVLVIGFLPFIVAQVMFFIRPPWMQEMLAGEPNNRAEVMEADVALDGVIPGERLVGPVETSVHGLWTLLMRHEGDCDAACEQRLLLLRQLYLTQGRHFESLQAVAVFDEGALPEALKDRLDLDFSVLTVIEADPAELDAWLAPVADWVGRADRGYLLLDRRGRPALHFPRDLNPTDARKDLARIMRLNNS